MADRDYIMIRIRGEAKKRLIDHKAENGIDMTFTVDKALNEYFDRLDALRAQIDGVMYGGYFTATNALDGEGE